MAHLLIDNYSIDKSNQHPVMSREPAIEENNFDEDDSLFLNPLSPANVEKDPEYRPRDSLASIRSSIKKESPTSRGMMTFIKSLIGTGVLALPFVINSVGLVPAWILLFIVGYLNLYTMKLVDSAASDVGVIRTDLGKLSQLITGRKWFRYFAEGNLYIMQVGCVIAGLVFIAKYLESVSCILGWNFMCGHKAVQFALIFAFVLPIMTITDLHYLAIPNAIALVFQLLFCLVFFTISFGLLSYQGAANGGLRASLSRWDFSNFPVAFATILYAYEGIGLLLEVRSSVAESSKFNKVLDWSFVVSTISYLLFGTVGALVYGDATQPIIFLNLDQTDKFIVFVEFMYLIAIILGIPSALFPVTRMIENLKVFRKCIVDETGKKRKIARQIIRLPLFLFLCGIAVVIPSFNSFLSFLGGFNFSILAFVVPVILYYVRFKSEKSQKLKLIFNWFLLVVGVILGITASVESIIDMAQDNSIPPSLANPYANTTSL